MGLFGRNALPAPPSSREAFQAVPFGPRQRTYAGGAGDDQVVEIGPAAAAVREHVVELHPQALERGNAVPRSDCPRAAPAGIRGGWPF